MFIFKITEVEEVCCGRSEPAMLHGLRKQVTEAEERPLELRRKNGKENAAGGRRKGKGRACYRERDNDFFPKPQWRDITAFQRKFLRRSWLFSSLVLHATVNWQSEGIEVMGLSPFF